MKIKITSLALALGLSTNLISLPPAVYAESVTDDATGIVYEVNDDGTTASVTGYSGTDANVVIPSELGGYTVTAIKPQIFNASLSIESVTVPGTVERLERNTFFQSPVLSVTLEEGVKYIDENAFYYSQSLSSIDLPSTIETISDSAFCGSRALTEITLPASIASVTGYAFYSCDSLANIYTEGDGSYYSDNGILFSSDGSETVLCVYPTGRPACDYTVPAEADTIGNWAFYGSNITSVSTANAKRIENYAFSGCRELTSADVSGADYVGASAFSNCTALTDITLSDTLTFLGSQAFRFCDSLTEITIPSTLTKLESSVFSQTQIKTLNLPAGITEVDDSAFENMKVLSAVTVDPENEYFCDDDGVLYDKAMTKLLIYPRNRAGSDYTVPEGVASIKSYAFAYSSLSNITLPESLETIGWYAFRECTSIEKIYIPPKVLSIERYAFYNCSDVTISGYDDTVAQTYAEENNIAFESLGEQPVTSVRVTTSAELLDAIGSYKEITLADGIYVTDDTLTLNRLRNLTLKAENSGKAEILMTYGYAPVADITNSQNVTFDGLILGHESLIYQTGCGSTAYSSGYVLRALASSNVTLTNCDLYGCGTVAVFLSNVNGFLADGCVMRDCKEYIAYFYNSAGDTIFRDCVISGNAYDPKYALSISALYNLDTIVTFERCTFFNNYSTIFSDLTDVLTMTDCVFQNNAWDEETPESYGVCLNGITWQIDDTDGSPVLRLGYPIEHEDGTVTASASGEVLPYSKSSLPWKGLSYESIDTADGVSYDPSIYDKVITDTVKGVTDNGDGTVTVSVSGVSNSEKTASVNVYAASYDENGALTGIGYETVTLDPYSAFGADITINGGGNVRAFIFDTNNTPLCESL